MRWIEKKDIPTLEGFLDSAGEALGFFMFYTKRGIAHIENVDTVVWGLVGDEIASYGHLDFVEGYDDQRWIGICVKEKFWGNRYGQETLRHLEETALQRDVRALRLSVRKKNVDAVNLYLRSGYAVFNENSESFFMMKSF